MQGYFDYNATTPTRSEVIEAMAEAMAEPLGNPSSMHAHGRRARHYIDEARDKLARLLNAHARQIIFTSGATEANNMALRGFVLREPDAVVVTTGIEHVSVLASADALALSGTRVERLSVDAAAQPDYEALAALTASHRCIVATAWANGETGHIADVERLCATMAGDSVLLMDAAQAVGRIPTWLGDGIDMLSLSAHKFGGPRGVGALAMTDDLIERVTFGGPQERDLRPGTENLPGIVGLGVAADLRRREMEADAARLAPLRERVWHDLQAGIGDVIRITPEQALPNTLTVAVGGVGADVLVAGLDLAGYSVSTGSACAAGAPEPSHVALGLGIDPRYVRGVIRISMGWDTDEADAAGLVAAFVQVVQRARKAA